MGILNFSQTYTGEELHRTYWEMGWNKLFSVSLSHNASTPDMNRINTFLFSTPKYLERGKIKKEREIFLLRSYIPFLTWIQKALTWWKIANSHFPNTTVNRAWGLYSWKQHTADYWTLPEWILLQRKWSSAIAIFLSLQNQGANTEKTPEIHTA